MSGCLCGFAVVLVISENVTHSDVIIKLVKFIQQGLGQATSDPADCESQSGASGFPCYMN